MIRPGIRRAFRLALGKRDAVEQDVDDEIALHLELRAAELQRQGKTATTAQREAEIRFGTLDHRRPELRAAARKREQRMQQQELFTTLRQDAGYAWRSLRNSPAFALTALLSLGLGLGANIAMFTLINSVMLRPLPFPAPANLYRAWSANHSIHLDRAWTSPLTFADWRGSRKNIADMGGYFVISGGTGLDLQGGSEPERVATAYVTAGFFSTLGAPPLLGRLPREEELARGGANHVVVLSWHLWSRRFGRSPSIVDSSITLSGASYRVIGVMPPAFRFPNDAVDLYTPYATLTDQMVPWSRDVHTLSMIVRAAPGIPASVIHDELRSMARRGASTYPEEAGWDDASIVPMQSFMVSSLRTPLLVLGGGVAFLLLMACANLGALLLARSASRERELAIRVAIGASRWRIARQMITESLLLACAGGVLSLLIAAVAVGLLAHTGLADAPMRPDVALDSSSVLAAVVLTLLTTVIFGVLPALRGARTDPQQALQHGARGSSGGIRTRLRSLLVVGQVAIAFMLATGAGLMLRTLTHLVHQDLGFRPERLITASIPIDLGRHPGDDMTAYYLRLLDRARQVPGLSAVAAIRTPPLTQGSEDVAFLPPGMPPRQANQLPTAANYPISDRYFATTETAMIAGREFDRNDVDGSPHVVIVNTAFARQYIGKGNALGQTILIAGTRPVQIVGVVADVHQESLNDAPQPSIYFPYTQSMRAQVTIVARAAHPLAALGDVRRAIHEIDPDQTITSLAPFDNTLNDALAQPRLVTTLLTIFGLVGMTLGATGVYGLLAFLVNERRRELGVRAALGAPAMAMFRTVLQHGLLLTLLGLLLGIGGAWGTTRLLRGMIFGVDAHDLVTFAAVAALLLAVGAAAGWIPARRATRIDPVEVLRS